MFGRWLEGARARSAVRVVRQRSTSSSYDGLAGMTRAVPRGRNGTDWWIDQPYDFAPPGAPVAATGQARRPGPAAYSFERAVALLSSGSPLR